MRSDISEAIKLYEEATGREACKTYTRNNVLMVVENSYTDLFVNWLIGRLGPVKCLN